MFGMQYPSFPEFLEPQEFWICQAQYPHLTTIILLFLAHLLAYLILSPNNSLRSCLQQPSHFEDSNPHNHTTSHKIR